MSIPIFKTHINIWSSYSSLGSIFCCSPMFYPIHISTSTQPWVSSHVVLHSPAFASLNLLPWPAVEAAPLLRLGSVSSSARWRMSPACCHASSPARSSPPMGSLMGKLGPCGGRVMASGELGGQHDGGVAQGGVLG
jgi:hypothetical protein